MSKQKRNAPRVVTVEVDQDSVSQQPALAYAGSKLPLPRVPVKALALKVEPVIPPGTTLGEALRGMFGGDE